MLLSTSVSCRLCPDPMEASEAPGYCTESLDMSRAGGLHEPRQLRPRGCWAVRSVIHSGRVRSLDRPRSRFDPSPLARHGRLDLEWGRRGALGQRPNRRRDRARRIGRRDHRLGRAARLVIRHTHHQARCRWERDAGLAHAGGARRHQIRRRDNGPGPPGRCVCSQCLWRSRAHPSPRSRRRHARGRMAYCWNRAALRAVRTPPFSGQPERASDGHAPPPVWILPIPRTRWIGRRHCVVDGRDGRCERHRTSDARHASGDFRARVEWQWSDDSRVLRCARLLQ